MGTMDAEFLKKLLAMFRMEAREHLNVISAELTKMEKSDSIHQTENVETMFREAHSLKGAARSVNLAEIVSLCQSMENVFSALKSRRITLSLHTGDLLQQAVDLCYRLVDGEILSASEKTAIKKLIRQLDGSIPGNETLEAEKRSTVYPEKLHCGEMERAVPPEETTQADFPEPPCQIPVAGSFPVAPESIRISAATLDALLLQAEEMISVKLATAQRMAELRDLKKAFDAWKKERQRERSIGILRSHDSADRLSADSFIGTFETRLTALVRSAEDDHRASGALIDMLLNDMKKTLMLPFSSILNMFPRFVRDFARAGGKKVELTTEGGEIEIDRRVLEEMKDPLIHLVRNCLDHGIEMPDERERNNKSACGNIKIGVTSRDSKIEISVSDDGTGIDVSKIKSSAVKHAAISQEAVNILGEQEALLLAFQSGVTTSPIITDISGRGLGLAIVREKVEKLNGTVTVDTISGVGTTFRMIVPLTLATFRGTLVRVSDQIFVLPSTNVERVTRAEKEAIQTVENRETLIFDGQPLSLVRLGDVLELTAPGDRQQTDNGRVQLVVLGSAEKRMAFMVDEVLCEQEVLVKPLGRQLSRVRNIMGATVLGSGKVVPILNVHDLLKTAVKKAPSFTSGLTEAPEKNSSILVVEDSITARMLLKNIFESAGYDVQTAVDGIDAFTALKSREFDIVVSDVEMPRMNGFDLTLKIRSDKKFSELPVVLVTALESRQDRERGIDVGADAYIVKSSFDQNNLLEVIGRLT
jgi:two-component system, chemotaxis family, sensor kinase CheA